MGQERLLFSIIVPTYARPAQLATCLAALVRLECPGDRFEVIVVDDGSENPPEDVIASFRDRLELTLLVQPHAGPATARNAGAAQARGKFLAFTDDDCAPASDWLQTLAARFAMASDRVVGGRILNSLPDNPYSTASQLLVDHLYAYYNANHSKARFFTSNNLALPADRFNAMGGFDTTFPRAAAEDREFCDRWLRHRYRMTYASEVVVYHIHALTFRTFWRQHFNYGRGAYHFHQVRTRRDQEPIKLEPLAFYLNLVCYPFSQAPGRRASLLASMLVISQVANAAGFFAGSQKAEPLSR
jgi:glycosyltransferase involved in cell wall biosynthesis